MRGRDLFGKVEGSLNLLSKIYKILPNKYVEFRWNRVERWHGYLGEYTFFEGGGFWPYHPDEWEKRLGDWIKIEE